MSTFTRWNFSHDRSITAALAPSALLAGWLAAAGCAQDATDARSPVRGVAASAVVVNPAAMRSRSTTRAGSGSITSGCR